MADEKSSTHKKKKREERDWDNPFGMSDEARDRFDKYANRTNRNVRRFFRDAAEDFVLANEEFVEEAFGIEPDFTDVIAWEPVTLNRTMRCRSCRKTIKKGTQGMAGFSYMMPPSIIHMGCHKKITKDQDEDDE